MIKCIQINIIFLLLILLTSCSAQNNSGLKKEEVIVKETSFSNLKEIDPYFIEKFSLNNFQPPSSITRNILEDKNNNLWFATFEGIFGYDGNKFTNYTKLKGLRRFRAFSLLEDRSGVIWVGTIRAGIYRYGTSEKKGSDKSFKNITKDDGLVNNDVGCIYEDENGDLWFGTRVGISKYDGAAFENFMIGEDENDNDFNSIVQDNDGLFYLGTRGEAYTFDGQAFKKITASNGKTFTNVRSIIKDRKGKIWLGGNDGLWNYDGKIFNNFTKDFIGNIYEDSKGTIWFSKSDPSNSYSMILCRLDNLSPPIKEVNITKVVSGNGQVFGITEDNEHNIWFGTERGVCRYNGETFEYFDN